MYHIPYYRNIGVTGAIMSYVSMLFCSYMCNHVQYLDLHGAYSVHFWSVLPTVTPFRRTFWVQLYSIYLHEKVLCTRDVLWNGQLKCLMSSTSGQRLPWIYLPSTLHYPSMVLSVPLSMISVCQYGHHILPARLSKHAHRLVLIRTVQRADLT